MNPNLRRCSITWMAAPLLPYPLHALRRAEICGLRWRDLNFESGTLHVAQQVQKIEGELVALIPKSDRSRRTIVFPKP